jgi:hypothetical protein
MTHMKIASLTLLAGLVLAAPALAQSRDVVVVRTNLSGGNEVPPPATATGAHGRVVVTIDRGAGRITYRAEVYNLPTGLTGAHIHVGPAGSNGPIIFDTRPTLLGASNDFSIEGSWTAGDLRPNAAAGINSFDDAIFAIASGVTYFNVHSQATPSGEIRGQLCPDAPLANGFNGVAVCTAGPIR